MLHLSATLGPLCIRFDMRPGITVGSAVGAYCGPLTGSGRPHEPIRPGSSHCTLTRGSSLGRRNPGLLLSINGLFGLIIQRQNAGCQADSALVFFTAQPHRQRAV